MNDHSLAATPPSEDVKNALTIADLGAQGYIKHEDRLAAFGDIARLLRHALPGLELPIIKQAFEE